jgi:Trk-type K+ transport system membrane component
MSDNNNNNSSSSNINKQELREDLLKSAVSFLSSPNVQSADKNKKTAFLEKKGLTQEEIDEAFKRVGDTTTLDTTTTATTTTTTTNLPTTAARIPIVPPRTHIPQVIYHPLPPTPSMPAEKVFALAVFFGIGTVGLTAAIVGVLKVNKQNRVQK